jgi:hypothetical protein
MPFIFANGAPLMSGSGYKGALGIKHKGRWVVFYHPGGLTDAWKEGHPGFDAQEAEAALKMGVNIVYYSFANYAEVRRKYRK